MDSVTSVLLDRAQDVRGLPRMVTASLAAHGVLVVMLLVLPILDGRTAQDDLRPVMTIVLGGAPGPANGGMTMASRPTESMAPLAQPAAPVKVQPQVQQPPAAKKPAMVLPTPDAKLTRPAKPAKVTSETARTALDAPPSSAIKSTERLPFGAAPPQEAANPNQGMGFGGLSTGGTGGAGGYLDVQNFCCPDYLVTMLQIIQGRWDGRSEVSGESVIKFVIQRDGRLTDIELEKSSGYAALDMNAQRTLFVTQRLPPLPAAFTESQLTVHLRFPYRR